jgi:hypothetical protein
LSLQGGVGPGSMGAILDDLGALCMEIGLAMVSTGVALDSGATTF